MKLRVSRLHFPVSTLGPGRRLGIWFQGCSIGCAGCVSQDTWSANGGIWLDTVSLVAQCRSALGNGLDGITITGGEPFEQPDALLCLLRELEDWKTAAELDVLCYSGLPYKRIIEQHAEILRHLDGLIPEPFRNHDPANGSWRGSSNQKVVALSRLGRSRLLGAEPVARAMQVEVTPEAIWFVGIPRPGDMERLRQNVAQRGLIIEDVSWLT